MWNSAAGLFFRASVFKLLVEGEALAGYAAAFDRMIEDRRGEFTGGGLAGDLETLLGVHELVSGGNIVGEEFGAEFAFGSVALSHALIMWPKAESHLGPVVRLQY